MHEGQTRADYVFATIGPPGSYTAWASGINESGQIVGYYDGHGFLLSGGTYTRLDVPGSYPDSTGASGINNAGQIVGSYLDASNRIALAFLSVATRGYRPFAFRLQLLRTRRKNDSAGRLTVRHDSTLTQQAIDFIARELFTVE